MAIDMSCDVCLHFSEQSALLNIEVLVICSPKGPEKAAAEKIKRRSSCCGDKGAKASLVMAMR